MLKLYCFSWVYKAWRLADGKWHDHYEDEEDPVGVLATIERTASQREVDKKFFELRKSMNKSERIGMLKDFRRGFSDDPRVSSLIKEMK